MTVDASTQQWIKICEGTQLEPYLDTVGKLTIGIGRNLSDCGISLDEAELMFQNDLKQTVSQLEKCSWYINQPQNVKNALINMNFNLGINKLSQFHGMIAALESKNYTLAAQHALDSLWAKQVGDRAKQIAVMISEHQ